MTADPKDYTVKQVPGGYVVASASDPTAFIASDDTAWLRKGDFTKPYVFSSRSEAEARRDWGNAPQSRIMDGLARARGWISNARYNKNK